MKSKTKKGYMCLTDYLYHLEEDMHPVKIYASKKLLYKARKCVKECGYAKVEIKLIKGEGCKF